MGFDNNCKPLPFFVAVSFGIFNLQLLNRYKTRNHFILIVGLFVLTCGGLLLMNGLKVVTAFKVHLFLVRKFHSNDYSFYIY